MRLTKRSAWRIAEAATGCEAVGIFIVAAVVSGAILAQINWRYVSQRCSGESQPRSSNWSWKFNQSNIVLIISCFQRMLNLPYPWARLSSIAAFKSNDPLDGLVALFSFLESIFLANQIKIPLKFISLVLWKYLAHEKSFNVTERFCSLAFRKCQILISRGFKCSASWDAGIFVVLHWK